MKRILTLSAFLAIFLGAIPAFALSLPWSTGSNIMIDLSAEYLLNKVEQTGQVADPGNVLYYNYDSGTNQTTWYTTDNGDTTLSVGDRLRAIFRIHDINVNSTDHFLPAGSMFAGVSEVEVTSITPSGVGGLSNFTFGVSSDFSANYATPGAMVAMYTSDSNPFAIENGGIDSEGVTDEEALVSNVLSGSLYWTFGFTGAGETPTGGEGWAANLAPNDISVFSGQSTTAQSGQVTFGLSLLDNTAGPQLVPNSVSQTPSAFIPVLGDGSKDTLYGSAGLFGIVDGNGDINTPMDATDSLRGTVNVVPEPTTLVLLGFGLIGIAAVGRKRRKA
jgi:hypothetical protein